MEERRLKNLLSHLSLYSASPSGNSAILNAINKAEALERGEKIHVGMPGNAQGNPPHLVEEREAHRSILKSRSSSEICESRQSEFVEETLMRAALSHPIGPLSQGVNAQLEATSQCKQIDCVSASFKQTTRIPSPQEPANHSFIFHSQLTAQKSGCSFISRTLSSEVEGDSPCMQMNDRGMTLRTHLQGCSLKTTSRTTAEVSQVESDNGAQLEHACSLPNAKHLKLEAQCTPFNSSKVLVDGFQAGDANYRIGITDGTKVFRAQNLRVSDSEPRAEGEFDKNVHAEQQASTRAPDVLLSSLERNLPTSRDMSMLNCEPLDIGIDTSGSMTLSRNNAMTGQRRHIVEDCIFCRIIQGQSPAFKLYEDEMCVCILDVHPLTHGHSLLIPKAHFPSLELTPPEVAAGMCATVPFISMAIMQATNCDSFNLLVNSGKAAGQVVFHTHFHIIPRRSGDNLWRSEDDSRRALPLGHETALLVQQIRHNLSNKCP